MRLSPRKAHLLWAPWLKVTTRKGCPKSHFEYHWPRWMEATPGPASTLPSSPLLFSFSSFFSVLSFPISSLFPSSSSFLSPAPSSIWVKTLHSLWVTPLPLSSLSYWLPDRSRGVGWSSVVVSLGCFGSCWASSPQVMREGLGPDFNCGPSRHGTKVFCACKLATREDIWQFLSAKLELRMEVSKG